MNRRGRRARTPLAIAILLLLALIPFALYRGSQVPEAEAAWWNESWQYRQSIAVTNNTTPQTNVYISASLDTSNTSKFQADCGDLRFTKQNGQLLPYYIASGCGTASTSVHVQLDNFPAGAQTFFAYYGNPSADNGFSNNDFLAEATNYTVGGMGSEETGPGPVAYWKFDEGSGSTANDSAGSNNGTITGATWANEDQCVSGKCLSFNSTSDEINVDSPDLREDVLTACLWINPAQVSDRRDFVRSGDRGAYSTNNWIFSIQGGGLRVYGDTLSISTDSPVLSANTWEYVCFVNDGSTTTIYLDGISVKSGAQTMYLFTLLAVAQSERVSNGQNNHRAPAVQALK